MGSAPMPRNGEAIARLYAAKGRPSFNPLIAHVGEPRGRAQRSGASMPPPKSSPRAFWPGPLTLVLPKRPDGGVADLALAGLDSVAVRVPAHPVARALLEAFERAGGGAVGQPLRPCLADQRRRTCSPICAAASTW